jgi:hypothetical protein
MRALFHLFQYRLAQTSGIRAADTHKGECMRLPSFFFKLDSLDSFAKYRLIELIPKFFFDHQAIILRILVAIRGIYLCLRPSPPCLVGRLWMNFLAKVVPELSLAFRA